jgi:hypothetical protein
VLDCGENIALFDKELLDGKTRNFFKGIRHDP